MDKSDALEFLFSGDKKMVELSRFTYILSFFKEFKGREWMQDIKDLFKTGWFFGEIDSKKSQQLLAETTNGCLIRFSSVFGNLTFSFNFKNKIHHSRIFHFFSSNYYLYDNKRFVSLFDLCDYFCQSRRLLCLSDSSLKDFYFYYDELDPEIFSDTDSDDI